MRVLFSVAECSPFVKVGGLADVAGSLPKALSHLGIDVQVALPLYGTILDSNFKVTKSREEFSAEFGGKEERVVVWSGVLPGSLVPVNFFENDEHLSAGPYEPAETISQRFEFFNQAVALWIQNHQFDIVHLHDWHTARLTHKFKIQNSKFKTVLTVHNLAAKGPTERELEEGIKEADFVTTVSPNYAREIQTLEFGQGMEELLREKSHQGKLAGILNGIDTSVWNPSSDSFLATRYYEHQAGSKQGAMEIFKRINKQSLLTDLGLIHQTQLPLFAFVGRLSKQKGIDILLDAWEIFLKKHHAHLLVLGTGDESMADELKDEEFRTQEKFGRSEIIFVNNFSEKLAHQIYAAADFLLVPSKFEPCGLTQMIGMRYGAIPIVRDTGGLHDSVKDGKTGFVFQDFSKDSLKNSLDRAWKSFQDESFLPIRTNCLNEDFSWAKSAKLYLQVYEKLLSLSSQA